jgi:hypothetical protein
LATTSIVVEIDFGLVGGRQDSGGAAEYFHFSFERRVKNVECARLPPTRRRPRITADRPDQCGCRARRPASDRLLSRDTLHPIDKVTARCRCRKRLTFRFINLDCFLHNLAKLFEHGLLVVTMATAPDEAGRAADVAVVLV